MYTKGQTTYNNTEYLKSPNYFGVTNMIFQ